VTAVETKGGRGGGVYTYLLDVSLGEVEDEVPEARDVDERAGAGAPELRVERIHCGNRARLEHGEETHRIWVAKTRVYYLSWTPWLRAASGSDQRRGKP
jgi:hypothetical protein